MRRVAALTRARSGAISSTSSINTTTASSSISVTDASRSRLRRRDTVFFGNIRLVALADRSDTALELCRRWSEEQNDTSALPITVFAKACYLIDRFGGPIAKA